MSKLLTKDDVRQRLLRVVQGAGGQVAAARQLKVSVSNLNGVLHGKEPAAKLLRALGLDGVTRYRRIDR